MTGNQGARAAMPVALTMGEPAGIGPDIALKAWVARRARDVAPFVLIADGEVMRERARLLGLDIPIREIADAGRAPAVFDSALPLMPLRCPRAVPGKPDGATAGAVIEAIRMAVELTRRGETAGVVTNPIAKSVLAREGFSHPGHTEFLAELSADGGPAPLPVMMLAADILKVVPVTTHIALREVPARLTQALITRVARITAEGLTRHFGIARPRLMFAGLNPHAGEEGLMGEEDDAVIRPAVEELAALGFDATGPVSADTMFHEEARRRYDVAMCMYHDQALIPVKTLAFDEAVNVTLGLPFLRTSPDHGTAFALAGTGAARETSLLAALRLASARGPRAAAATGAVA
jgi:4-hydroxythreonine-4-phosphate dehydrogenase